MPKSGPSAALALLLLAGAGGLSGCVASARDTVRFAGPPFPPTEFARAQARRQGRALDPRPADQVIGHLARPTGPGPYPAVVLLHGCYGRGSWNEIWLARLVDWGYVVLDVDSHATRGVTKAEVCGRGTAPEPVTRTHDAFGAKAFLAKLDYVDPARIAVMGRSQGGATVLQSVERRNLEVAGGSPFRAGIAVSPPCAPVENTGTPLLILIGGADNWTPASRCRDLASREDMARTVTYVEYPGAHHGFDIPGMDVKVFNRYVVRHDADAERDAIRRIRMFLARTMG